MIDRDQGWSRSENAFFRTGDGGRTWTKVAAAGALGPSWGVTANGGAWGVLPGSSQLIRIPAKGGAEYLPVPCNNGCYLAEADFDPFGQNGLAFGLLPLRGPYFRIVVFRTTDKGRTWAALRGPDAEVNRGDLVVRMTGQNSVLAAVGCDFFATTDLGQSWRRNPDGDSRPTLCGGDSTPFAIRFVSARNGWLRTASGWVLQTGDGGASWRVSSLGKQLVDFPSAIDDWVSFADGLDGLVAVEDGVLATKDGGKTWAPVGGLEKDAWSVSCADGRCVLVSERRIAEYTFDKP